MLGERLEAFVKASPVAVMVTAVLERVFNPERLERVFEEHVVQGYTKELAFAACVALMGDVAFRAARSVSAYLQVHLEELGVSRPAVYGKLNRLEPEVSAGLVAHAAHELRAVLEAMPGAPPPVLEGWRLWVLDGSHFPGTDHRLKVLRGHRAAALPGQALVLYDPRYDLIEAVIPCEDAYAQERALYPQALAWIEPGDCLVCDRNFCTLEALFKLDERDAAFVTRQHANLPFEPLGPREQAGVDARGRPVYEQPVRLGHPETGETLDVRRLSVALPAPEAPPARTTKKRTKKAKTAKASKAKAEAEGAPDPPREEWLNVLTNLPREQVSAVQGLDLYDGRWGVEEAFERLAVDLQSEYAPLAYPRAALFTFCTAAAVYNAVATVKGAIRAAHGPEVVKEDLSSYYLTEEVARVTPGLRIALPAPLWSPYTAMPAPAFAATLVQWARAMNLRRYRKHKRGPKKPPPKNRSPKGRPHFATARLLNLYHVCRH